MQNNQRGSANIFGVIIVIIVAIITVAGIVYYRAYSKRVNKNSQITQNNPVQESNSFQQNDYSQQNHLAQQSTNSSCKPANAGLFTSNVTNMSNITLIQNPIRIIGGNNIKTHSYIEVSKKSPVYAPMDATLSGGANYYETMGEMPVTKVQYILSFNDDCDVNFWLDHIVDVPDKIKSAFPAEPQNDTQNVEVKKIDIKAGELVGYSNQEGRARFDFGVINLKGPETSLTTNSRFRDDPIVKTSDKYRYATCPYNLYSLDKQKKYQALYDSRVDGDQELIDDICK